MTAPMGCAEAVERLWGLLDDSLDRADRDAVEQHLALCLRCCGELAFGEELQRLLRERTGGELPADARDRLEQLIDELDDVSDQGVTR